MEVQVFFWTKLEDEPETKEGAEVFLIPIQISGVGAGCLNKNKDPCLLHS
jgi:hypothetical protein